MGNNPTYDEFKRLEEEDARNAKPLAASFSMGDSQYLWLGLFKAVARPTLLGFCYRDAGNPQARLLQIKPLNNISQVTLVPPSPGALSDYDLDREALILCPPPLQIALFVRVLIYRHATLILWTQKSAALPSELFNVLIRTSLSDSLEDLLALRSAFASAVPGLRLPDPRAVDPCAVTRAELEVYGELRTLLQPVDERDFVRHELYLFRNHDATALTIYYETRGESEADNGTLIPRVVQLSFSCSPSLAFAVRFLPSTDRASFAALLSSQQKLTQLSFIDIHLAALAILNRFEGPQSVPSDANFSAELYYALGSLFKATREDRPQDPAVIYRSWQAALQTQAALQQQPVSIRHLRDLRQVPSHESISASSSNENISRSADSPTQTHPTDPIMRWLFEVYDVSEPTQEAIKKNFNTSSTDLLQTHGMPKPMLAKFCHDYLILKIVNKRAPTLLKRVQALLRATSGNAQPPTLYLSDVAFDQFRTALEESGCTDPQLIEVLHQSSVVQEILAHYHKSSLFQYFIRENLTLDSLFESDDVLRRRLSSEVLVPTIREKIALMGCFYDLVRHCATQSIFIKMPHGNSLSAILQNVNLNDPQSLSPSLILDQLWVDAEGFNPQFGSFGRELDFKRFLLSRLLLKSIFLKYNCSLGERNQLFETFPSASTFVAFQKQFQSSQLRTEVELTGIYHRFIEASKLYDIASNFKQDHYRSFASILISTNDIKLGRRIGKGATAHVFTARYIGADVAVKRLKPNYNTGKELASWKSLSHPQIVQLYGVVMLDTSQEGIVMELLHQDLYSYLKDRRKDYHDPLKLRPLSLHNKAEFKRVASMIASGLAYMHAQRPPIAHRDLKSLNVLVNLAPDRVTIVDAKLSDFGFSRPDSGTDSLAHIGNPLWQAPELFFGIKTTDVDRLAVDIYALGVIFCEMILKEDIAEFTSAPNIKNYYTNYTTHSSYAESKIYPRISSASLDLDPLIKPCLVWEPRSRPSARAVLSSLSGEADSSTSPAPTSFSPSPSSSTPPSPLSPVPHSSFPIPASSRQS